MSFRGRDGVNRYHILVGLLSFAVIVSPAAADPPRSTGDFPGSQDCSAGEQSDMPSAQTLSNEWQSEVARRLSRAQSYPPEAARQGIGGTVYLKFRADRRGRLKTIAIDCSSGSSLLDEAALKAVQLAQPLPRLPCGAPDAIDFILPIRFSVEH